MSSLRFIIVRRGLTFVFCSYILDIYSYNVRSKCVQKYKEDYATTAYPKTKRDTGLYRTLH